MDLPNEGMGGRMRIWFLCSILLVTTVGCGGTAASDDGSQGSDLGDSQTPPRGRALIEPWIAQRFYTSWKCEPEPHAASPFGAHGRNRVCSNDLASGAGPGEFPVGSATLKEVYSGADVFGYSVSRHTSAGRSGNTWYWYERIGAGGAITDGQGSSACVGCHQLAGNQRQGHDYVYTQVR